MRNNSSCNNILEAVGRTPMVKLDKVANEVAGIVYGKCEFMNPGGSVKDRIGLAMVEAAEREGVLKKDGVIVEATSGNTGVALALVAAIRGYRCIFTMPDKMSREKVQLLESFGAEVVITPTDVHPDHPDHKIAKKILPKGSGSMIAFGIKGGKEAGAAFIDNVKLASHLANVGDTRTLVIHPASATHSQMDEATLKLANMSHDMIRLSVGIEDIEDIINDFEDGFRAAKKPKLVANK